MSVQERQASLLNEAKALSFFFGVSSDVLVASFKAFDELYASSAPVSSDEFTDSLNAIDAEIEDLCISGKITQERLEELMDNNFAYKSVVIE
jgi:hypothetical protein